MLAAILALDAFLLSVYQVFLSLAVISTPSNAFANV